MIRDVVRARRGDRAWAIAFALAKLRARGRLPGAAAYDHVARGFDAARRAGADALDLMPAAMASSYLLNTSARSGTFAAWLADPARAAFEDLVVRLDVDASEWVAFSAERRAAVVELATQLAPDGGLAALTKVLALLCPRLVPAMPDDVIAWLAGEPPSDSSADHDADAQTRGTGAILMTLDRFAAIALENTEVLRALGEGEGLAPAAVLDRLLWFEACGHRHFHEGSGVGWWWVRDGAHEAIVPVGESCRVSLAPGACIHLATITDDRWREAAARSLGEATR
jgi:hypothetical protein